MTARSSGSTGLWLVQIGFETSLGEVAANHRWDEVLGRGRPFRWRFDTGYAADQFRPGRHIGARPNQHVAERGPFAYRAPLPDHDRPCQARIGPNVQSSPM